MKAETEQPDALWQRMKRGQQRLAGGGERVEVGHWRGEAFRPGDDREVAVLDLERDGAPGDLRAPDPVPRIAGDSRELGGETGGVGQIFVEGALGADRLVRPVGFDLA